MSARAAWIAGLLTLAPAGAAARRAARHGLEADPEPHGPDAACFYGHAAGGG